MSSLPELVADSLNGGTFTTVFNAEYRLFPETDVKNLESVKVSTFDGPRTSDRVTRGVWEHIDVVFVVVQKKVDAEASDSTTQTAALITLLREIETHFEDLTASLTGGYEFMRFDEATPRVPFSLDDMRNSSVYTTVVGLEFTS